MGNSSAWSLCLQQESLLHVTAGCQSYLEQGRFTWHHISVLNFIATSFQSVKGIINYCDIPLFQSPSIITGDSFRPVLLISISKEWLYIIEPTVGFEHNLRNNSNLKRIKYKDLIEKKKEQYNNVKFVNLSISILGVFDEASKDFLDMLLESGFDKTRGDYVIRIIINITSTHIIRTSYYILCCRNKEWSNPDLMKY